MAAESSAPRIHRVPSVDEINAFLGSLFQGARNRCVEVSERHAVAVFEPDADSLRPGGLISGPTQFSMADAVLYYATFGAIGIEPMAVTSELSIRFLRPAVGDRLWGRADLETVGSRSIVGNVRVWTESPDKPCAVAQGTYARPRIPWAEQQRAEKQAQQQQ